MGLKCSLLGHTFDETDVEREREERGSEVVTVIRDVERCSRCGAERVVAENKEVVAVVEGDEVGLGADERPTDGGTAAKTAAGESTGTTGGLGGVVERSGALEDDDTDADADATHPAVRRSEADEQSPENVGGEADEDAEILTDDGPTERSPGQWPDDTDSGEWRPEPLGGDGDADNDEAAARDEATARDDPAVAPAPDPDPEPTPASGADPVERGFTVADGSLACPDCGHRVDAASSFRAGDSCPACKQGYLEQE